MAKRISLAPGYRLNIEHTDENPFFNPSFFADDNLYKIFNYEVYWGGRNSGKCFAKGTKVVMFSGELKNVEDVVVGDQLMGIDSKPRTVLGLSCGIGELYKIHQNLGIDYVVNQNHILCLKKSHSCQKSPGNKQRYTSYPEYTEISVLDYLEQSNRWKQHFFGYRTSIEFEEKELFIDPYFLGVWLGDGTSQNISITTEDQEVVDFIYQYIESINHVVHIGSKKGNALTYSISLSGYGHPQYIRDEWAKIIASNNKKTWSGNKSVLQICNSTGFDRRNISFWKKQIDFLDKIEFYRNNPESYDVNIISNYVKMDDLRKCFIKYNLFGNKHIPDDYLHSSMETRKQLLAGLIDTDGNMQGNCYDITFVNKLLAEQTRYIAHSLGLRCSLQECRKECVNNGVWGTYYRLNISGNTQIIPVKIERKKIISYNKRTNPMTTGISVSPIGIGEYFGFEVDGDHKFLLEDFTVTHNSKWITQKKVIHLSNLPKRNMIAMRLQATDCRNSCFNEIYKTIHELKLQDIWQIRENPDMRMTNLINDNEIVFTGMDKVENIKSITFKNGNATDLWYEEAVEEQYPETMIVIDNSLRSIGQKCSLIVSFNPVLETHWIKTWMDDLVKSGMDVYIHHSTYKDNLWVDPEYAAKLERLKFSDPYHYRVDCLGLWGTKGQSVFNANKVSERMKELELYYKDNPPQQIDFSYELDSNGRPLVSTLKPYRSDIGETMVFAEPNPKHPYVAALDTAGEGIDPYCLQITDNITDEQVAVFSSQKTADECMLQVYGLIHWYNDALIAPEVNFSDYPILKLKEWGYSNIFQRESPKDDYHDTLESKLGFRMSVGNRQSVIDNLIEWTKNNLKKIFDLETLREMLSFTRQIKKNKGIFMGAEQGAHDDRVIAQAILLKAKEQQTCEEQAEMKTIEGYWTLGELNVAVLKGKISEETMKEYLDKQKPRKGNELRRKSRYGR